MCIWQRFPSQSQSHCLLFLADLSTDPTRVPQMSVRDRSTPSLQYNHSAYLHMEDKKRKAQPSALASSGGQDKRRVWGIRYQVTEGPEQSRKSRENRKESESGM